ncbi:glucosamine-6-phosphate deaminase [Ligilactobacillus faecis]|uniref:Glucosamine-6-phosphate deaminase n=1 Tax=Ligilactobacillus faecis TaxID=762833 RepID=A0ABV4DUT5_9LACO
MEVIVVKDKVAGGKKAAEIFKQEYESGAKVFGLATGGTPETTYAELVKSSLDFSDAISINLDEYVGLAKDDPQSYHYYMQEHLFKDKPFKHSYLPNGKESDAKKETARYHEVIETHPIDLQLLGIGENGHIGFNEPGTPFDSTTAKIKLTDSTIKANSRYFADPTDVPQYAYSMGIGEIMQAKHILLEAFGENKAQAVKEMLEGEVTPDVPASVLQKHPKVTVIVDEAAAKLLTK